MASKDIPVTINGHTVVGTAKTYLDSDRSVMAIVTIDRGAAFLEELRMPNLTGMSFTSPHGEINEAVETMQRPESLTTQIMDDIEAARDNITPPKE